MCFKLPAVLMAFWAPMNGLAIESMIGLKIGSGLMIGSDLISGLMIGSGLTIGLMIGSDLMSGSGLTIGNGTGTGKKIGDFFKFFLIFFKSFRMMAAFASFATLAAFTAATLIAKAFFTCLNGAVMALSAANLTAFICKLIRNH